ncbi:MAG: adenosylcobinamide amidohydrolase [Pseudomonadota bacterium]
MMVSVAQPWLVAEFDQPLRVLSWSLNHPGFTTADRVVWREVKNADLTKDFDVYSWFMAELAAHDYNDAIGFLTSRDVTQFTHRAATFDDVNADAVATVGLSNAERVGQRGNALDFGTINIAVAISAPLSDAALIEALSIAVQARTTAVIEFGPDLAQGRATGTGTDCIAIAAPRGEERYAGMHTATGQAVGAAVLDAVAKGVQDWMNARVGET